MKQREVMEDKTTEEFKTENRDIQRNQKKTDNRICN